MKSKKVKNEGKCEEVENVTCGIRQQNVSICVFFRSFSCSDTHTQSDRDMYSLKKTLQIFLKINNVSLIEELWHTLHPPWVYILYVMWEFCRIKVGLFLVKNNPWNRINMYIINSHHANCECT